MSVSTIWFGDRPKLIDLSFQNRSRFKQVRDKLIVDVDDAFVFGAVAALMAEVEHAPNLGTDTERVGQDLENCVAIRRPIPMPAKCGEGQGVGRPSGRWGRPSPEKRSR